MPAVSIQAQIKVVSPPNFSVTSPGFSYSVNGSGNNPGIAVNAGATYLFHISTSSIHPVDICTNATISAHYSGASAQVINSGDMSVTIPATNYPPFLYYICNIHGFNGKITVNPPQPPPTALIKNLSVSSNLVIVFTGGTNTIPVTPQFSSNLVNGAWINVPSYTNTFNFNGTNTISFDRLDPACGPNVYLRISQLAN